MLHSNSSTASDIALTTKPVEQQTQPHENQLVSPDELLTIAEVAAYLKLSRRTTWRWCRSGQLPAVRVGHQWRVTRSDLENFIRRRGKLK